MDYRNANYCNVGYDKKIIFIAKVGSLRDGLAYKNAKAPAQPGLLVADLAAEKGIICCPRCPKKLERLKRDEIN